MKISLKHSIVNVTALVFALLMNYLAVTLPLGGNSTGDLSAMFPNLFVPAGFTFSIWGVIYLLQILFVIVNFKNESVLKKAGPWFAINMIANATWIAVWHATFIELSVVVMLLLLVSLIVLYSRLVVGYPSISFFVKVPISVYLGWISVATIANITTLLVDHGITDLGLGAANWAAIMFAIAGLLGLYMVWSRKDIFFAAVILWASYGAYSKRIIDGSDQDSIVELITQGNIIAMAVAILVGIFLVFKSNKLTT